MPLGRRPRRHHPGPGRDRPRDRRGRGARPRPVARRAAAGGRVHRRPGRDREGPRRRHRRGGHGRRRARPHADPRRPGAPASPWSPPTRSCSPPTRPSCWPRPRRRASTSCFEASVGGGIPLIRPLRESLAGDRIRRVLGIVNGTTNYILTRMTEDGSPFGDVLADAQRLGYAEADPTADVGGHDAAAKAAIVASIAFGAQVVSADVAREGIAGVTADDITSARELGYVVKLLAIAEEDGRGVAVRVHPAMVPVSHPLASVRDSFNAIFIEGAAVGQLMLYGRGAGGNPTASAVLGDLIDAARNLKGGSRGATLGMLVRKPVLPLDDLRSRFYVTMDVADRPDVLSQIAGVFGAPPGVDRVRAAEGPGRRGPPEHRHPHGARAGDAGRPRRGPRARRRRPRAVGHPRASATTRDHGRAPGAGPGSSRPTAPTCPSPRPPPSSRSSRAARRSSRRPALSERLSLQVFLKYEGLNPTGSFKDRGMTMAISKAVEEGAHAVICASTGNTSASAAAYAARAGILCAVLIPEGKIALGKLAQALIHGARVMQIRGNFDRALDLVRHLGETAQRSRSSTPSTRSASRGRRRRPSRSSTCSARRPTSTASRSATPATSRRTGGATASTTGCGRRDEAARACSGCRRPGRPHWCAGQPIEHPETIATAIRIGNPASWDGAIAAARRLGRRHRRRDRRRDPRGLPAPRRRGRRLLRAGVGRRPSPGCSRPSSPGSCTRARRSCAR